MLGYADEHRCPTNDDLCRRVAVIEPSLPIHPPFVDGQRNPCIDHKGRLHCLPSVHLISGWHMLTDEALTPWLSASPAVQVRNAGCFNLWDDDDGARKWAAGWGGPPPNASHLIMTTACSAKLLTWHPEYAGRYVMGVTILRPSLSSYVLLGCAKLARYASHVVATPPI